ncbi:MAG: AAA family ATPase [Bacteroidales bacterium]|nr:AAA family ATPase [Candidatus Liminaster caballi]
MDNPQLDLAYNYAQYTRRNIFLTGKAGTGKTTFLRHLRNTSHKRMIVVAPTGVAAINAGGVTIHSFFQLAPGLFLPEVKRETKNKYGYSKHKINILRTLDLLVIDEISMVRCDLLDAIDEVLRRFQDHYRPFGGVQLLLIGDIQQLAPVAADNEWPLLQQHGYTTPYFFGSKALQQTDYTTIELRHVYRQADQTFIGLLNKVRENCLDDQALQLLNSRYKPAFRPDDREGYITLTTHNYQAQEINQERLALLNTAPVTFSASVNGDFPEISYPTDAQLTLKAGAQVMFCKNDSSSAKLYFNGKIGRVTQIANGHVWVESKTEDGIPQDIEVTPQEWTNTKYETDPKSGEIVETVAGTFTQIPLRTAWAITIHKSQGLTFDHCIINAGRAFSPGQVYVALSRCRTLEGLVLSTPITTHAIMSDPDVVGYNKFVEQNQPDEQQLVIDRLQCVGQTLCALFDYMPMMMQFRHMVRIADEHLPRAHKPFVAAIKELCTRAENELETIGMRFQNQIRQLLPLAATYDDNAQLKERVKKGNDYFLIKTTEILDDFVTTGLPTIDNQRVKEQITLAFDNFRQDYKIKTYLLTQMTQGFTLDRYWNAKAAATMAANESTPAKIAGKTTKTKKRKTKQ